MVAARAERQSHGDHSAVRAERVRRDAHRYRRVAAQLRVSTREPARGLRLPRIFTSAARAAAWHARLAEGASTGAGRALWLRYEVRHAYVSTRHAGRRA